MKISAIFAVLALALAALAADAGGKWKAIFEGDNGPIELLYNFQHDGAKLTGSVTGPQGEIPISEGKVEGDAITFTVTSGDVTAVHKGKISGDQIQFKIDVGDRTLELNAQRVK